MPLENGRRLGHYEILMPLGAGGMGEVYKARDTRLERTVAVKILPPHVALNEDMQTRFQREAKAISSLSHPHICTLHDVGQADGLDFLVMEYLEGRTLADRLKEGPLPTPELLRIAIQVADALDKAHRQGLVHRDLKPGNVMLTKEGAKLLDFGLAKLTVPGGTTESATQVTLTITGPLTAAGTILGTIQYMAPEALEGREADARSDIFAFGALLYEMATGQRAFSGGSQASLIASILKEQPAPVSQLQPLAPPMLEQVISQCLAKDPEQRWQTAGDLRRALQWIVDGGSQVGVPVTVSRRRKRREAVLWGALALAACAAGWLGWTAWRLDRQPVRTVRSTIELAAGSELMDMAGGAAELSPDGTKVVYAAKDSSGGDPRLWVRSLDALVAVPLPGTEYGYFPFWSADSRTVAFFADGKLKKILAAGGPVLTVCDAPSGRGGSWNADGVIIFTPSATDVVHRVAAAGGQAAAVTVRDSTHRDVTHRWPRFLPDGDHFLFFTRTGGDSGSEQDAICVGSLSSPQVVRVAPAKSNAVYAEGHILYVYDGTLMALPFDAGRLEATGDAVPVAERVSGMASWSRSVFTAAPGGLLLYREGEVQHGSQLSIVGLDGAGQADVGPLAPQYSPRVAPDGLRVAVDSEDASGNTDVWIWDLERSIRTRLTFEAGLDRTPVWSPDGSLVAFYSRRDPAGIWVKPSDGTGEARLVTAVDPSDRCFPRSWSPDGRFLAYALERNGNFDVMQVDVAGDQPPVVLAGTPFNEYDPAYSPDGRWLAFGSNESGREEVYVTPWPGPGGRWQVSTDEGDRPVWAPDGSRIYYLNNEDEVSAAEVSATGGAFRAGRVTTLFAAKVWRPGNFFDVFPDGQRLLVNVRTGTGAASRLVLVQNWQAERR